MYYLQKIKNFLSILWRDLKNIWQDASILLKAIVIVAILFISIDLVLYFSKFHNGFSNTQGDWGTFGDFLGGTLNPIFGFFGFLALLATLSLQRKQLDEQRESMALSNKTQVKQQFEGTFFTLLNGLNQAYEKPNSTEPRRGIQTSWPSSLGHKINKIYQKPVNSLDNILTSPQHSTLFTDICQIFQKDPDYFKTMRLTLMLLDSLAYRHLLYDSLVDKNFYVDLLLARQDNQIILSIALLNVPSQSFTSNTTTGNPPLNSQDCINLPDLILKDLIRRLGLLRELDFSPFNQTTMNNSTSPYAQHPITLALVETFGEQAFKPIEAPPIN